MQIQARYLSLSRLSFHIKVPWPSNQTDVKLIGLRAGQQSENGAVKRLQSEMAQVKHDNHTGTPS
jgi:hypothetical protein